MGVGPVYRFHADRFDFFFVRQMVIFLNAFFWIVILVLWLKQLLTFGDPLDGSFVNGNHHDGEK